MESQLANLGSTNQLSTSGAIGVINLTPASPPVFSSVAVVGNSLILSDSNGTARASYYTPASTNLNLPVHDWSPILTSQFHPGGFFRLTNPVDPAELQMFFRLNMP